MVGVDDAVHVAAGSARRGRLGSLSRRAPAPVFAVLGVVLVGGGVAVPAYETVLVAWGGTALFVALFLGLVAPEPTVPATVAADIHTVAAARARERGAGPSGRYVPTETGVRLVPDGEPVGARLLATVAIGDTEATPSTRAAALVDALVHHLELADRAEATVGESRAELTARSRLATDELYDHPVASVFAVGLAETVDRPVAVETSVTDEGLVVTCRWDAAVAHEASTQDAEGDVGSAADEARTDVGEARTGTGEVQTDAGED